MKPRFSAALGMLGILALATGCQSSPEPSGANVSVQTDATASAQPADRAGLLRPTLERAAVEARQLELDPDTVLSLFATILKETK